MSGHSKWATIKHRKGAQDAKRGKEFGKIIKEITVASRLGGADIDANPRLRTAVMSARAANMPKDNVDRAIKKGVGDTSADSYTEMMYEGYGPGGVAIMVDILTDNRNRVAADIRAIFNKGGGHLGASGCVSYLFKRKGLIVYDGDRYTEEELLEPAIESGAADVQGGEMIEVYCAPTDFEQTVREMEKRNFEHVAASISWVADSSQTLEPAAAERALKLIESLDDHEDVREVSTNLDIPDTLQIPNG